MTIYLDKFKFMPLSDYDTSDDAEDEICAVEISGILGNSQFPNWSAKVSLSSGTSYTVGSGALSEYKAGYVWFGGDGWSGDVSINGTSFNVGGWYTEDGHDRKLVFFPVSEGDSFTCTNGTSRYFLPASWSV